jgi:cytochrome b561
MPPAPTIGQFPARPFAIIHGQLIWVLLGFIGVHVVAALVHFSLFRDGVMRGMFLGRSDASAAYRE